MREESRRQKATLVVAILMALVPFFFLYSIALYSIALALIPSPSVAVLLTLGFLPLIFAWGLYGVYSLSSPGIRRQLAAVFWGGSARRAKSGNVPLGARASNPPDVPLLAARGKAAERRGLVPPGPTASKGGVAADLESPEVR